MHDEQPGLRQLRTRMMKLRAMPGFAMLDMDTLELLAESSRVRRFRKGDVLLTAGAPVDHVYMAIEGGIEAHRGEFTRDVQLFGGIGFLDLLAGGRAGVDATVVADCNALEVPAATAVRVMTESFAITKLAIRALARQLLSLVGPLPPTEAAPDQVDIGTKRVRPLTMVERLIMLRHTPLGKYANMDASAEMARGMAETKIAEGETLWSVGEPSTFWVGVEYGRVRCTTADDRVGWAGARKVLGVLEGWGDLPRSYTAVAETELVVHRVEIATMLAIAETHTEMGVQLSRFLARNLIAVEDAQDAPPGDGDPPARPRAPRPAEEPARRASTPTPPPLLLGPNES